MKRFATLLLLTSLLCGCPEKKTEPAPAQPPAAAASEDGGAAKDAVDDGQKTAEEIAEDSKAATKKGTDKAKKAIGAVLGD